MSFLSKKAYKAVATGTVLVVLGLSVLGFAFFDHGMDAAAEPDCFVAKMTGEVCPLSITGFALHHAIALKALLGAPTSPFVLFAAYVFFLALAVAAFAPALRPKLSFERFHAPPLLTQSGQSSRRWLSLLENSPSF